MQTTATSQKALPQTKEALLKSYQKRLKDDVRAMVDNYVEIIKLGNVKVCGYSLFNIFSVHVHYIVVNCKGKFC